MLIQLNVLTQHREEAEVFSLTHTGSEILLDLSQAMRASRACPRLSALGLQWAGKEAPCGEDLGSCLIHRGEQGPSTLQHAQAAELRDAVPYASLGSFLTLAFSL